MFTQPQQIKTSSSPPPQHHQRFRGSDKDLHRYKVVGSLAEHVLLVLAPPSPTALHAGQTLCMKVIRKQAAATTSAASENSSSSLPTIVPTELPYMVRLVQYIDVSDAIYVVTTWAKGGRLFDYIENYCQNPFDDEPDDEFHSSRRVVKSRAGSSGIEADEHAVRSNASTEEEEEVHSTTIDYKIAGPANNNKPVSAVVECESISVVVTTQVVVAAAAATARSQNIDISDDADDNGDSRDSLSDADDDDDDEMTTTNSDGRLPESQQQFFNKFQQQQKRPQLMSTQSMMNSCNSNSSMTATSFQPPRRVRSSDKLNGEHAHITVKQTVLPPLSSNGHHNNSTKNAVENVSIINRHVKQQLPSATREECLIKNYLHADHFSAEEQQAMQNYNTANLGDDEEEEEEDEQPTLCASNSSNRITSLRRNSFSSSRNSSGSAAASGGSSDRVCTKPTGGASNVDLLAQQLQQLNNNNNNSSTRSWTPQSDPAVENGRDSGWWPSTSSVHVVECQQQYEIELDPFAPTNKTIGNNSSLSSPAPPPPMTTSQQQLLGLTSLNRSASLQNSLDVDKCVSSNYADGKLPAATQPRPLSFYNITTASAAADAAAAGGDSRARHASAADIVNKNHSARAATHNNHSLLTLDAGNDDANDLVSRSRALMSRVDARLTQTEHNDDTLLATMVDAEDNDDKKAVTTKPALANFSLHSVPLQQQQQRKKKNVSDRMLCTWLAELVVAVDALHQVGIVLGDLNPDNILLDAGGHVCLTYFSQWRVAPRRQISRKAVGMLYAAPELRNCCSSSSLQRLEQELRLSCDSWSFGVIAFELLTRTPLYLHHNNGNLDAVSTSVILPNDSLLPPAIAAALPTTPTMNGDKNSSSVDNILSNLVSAEARDLLYRLLKYKPEERLPFGRIRDHAYFRLINWHKVETLGMSSA